MNKIYKFGWSSVLFMGADRELTLITAFSCFVVSIYSFSFIIIGVSIIVWMIMFYFLRLMAKSDSLMRLIYIKHIKYKKYYYAKSTFFCISHRIYK